EVEVVLCGVVVVTVTAGVVVVVDGQDHPGVLMTWAPGGSGSADSGVPAGMFWKVSCCPPRIVTVTEQPSASALGIAARPNTMTAHPAATAAILSLRLLNTVAYSSRKVPRAISSQQS